MDDGNFNFLNLPALAQVEILSQCDFETMMEATLTSQAVNSLVFSEPRLVNRVKVRLDLQQFDIRFVELLISQRNYTSLKVVYHRHANLGLQRTFLKYLEVKGSFLKSLSIASGSFDDVALLMQCPNLEVLKLHAHVEYFHGLDHRYLMLPKLKTLILLDTKIHQIKIFGNVRGLTNLSLQQNHVDGLRNDQASTYTLERIILQQNGLKKLKIRFLESRTLDLNLAIFQLKKLTIVSDTLRGESGQTFLQTQRPNLKNVKIVQFATSRNLEIGIFGEILKLSKMISLTLKNLVALSGFVVESNESRQIKNNSLKELIIHERYLFWSPQTFCLGHLLPFFRKLESIQLHSDFLTVPSDVLQIVTAHNTFQRYVPLNLTENPEAVAENLLLFFARHEKVSSIVLGDARWINSQFSLPLNFYEKISADQLNLRVLHAFNFNQDIRMFTNYTNIREFKAFNENETLSYRATEHFLEEEDEEEEDDEIEEEFLDD